MELQFIEEDIPKSARGNHEGRKAEPWEDHIEPLKNSPGKSFRVWTYEKKTSAVGRASNVSSRVFEQTPYDDWTIVARQVPNSDVFGVYVQYNGTLTESQVQEKVNKRLERAEKMRRARERLSKASMPNTDLSDDDYDEMEEISQERPMSARERVAAAKAARAS
jgi:hypothetical protein